jgi:hypothetical protein
VVVVLTGVVVDDGADTVVDVDSSLGTPASTRGVLSSPMLDTTTNAPSPSAATGSATFTQVGSAPRRALAPIGGAC